MTVTRTCRHWFQLVFLVNLLLFQRPSVSTANEQADASADSDAEVEESMYTLMDSILEDLTAKYDSIKTDDFWHPYAFGTGNDNREVINVVDILEHRIPGKFIQWKKAQLGLKQYLVGLTASSIEIYDSKLNKVSTKDMPFTLNTMEIFTRWDTDNLTPFMVVVVATSSPSIFILKSSGQEELMEIGSFPLPTTVQAVTVCNTESSEKLMLVPQNPAMPISIYNIEISQSEAQLWFFQRLSEPGFESAIAHQPDTVDSLLLISRANQMNIYQFDALLGQFSVKQSLPLQHKCHRLLSFTMMYQHYVGCITKGASQEVQFIGYNFNMNEYEESVLKKVKASEMFPIVVGGSRGDLVLVTRNEEEAAVNTLLYDGESELKTGNIQCKSASCAKLTTLSNGESFEFKDNTALVLPTPEQEDSATVLMFLTELTAAFSPVLLQSKGLFEEFKVLSKEMNKWRNSVSNAENILKNKLNTEGDNTITGNWEIKSLVAEAVDVKGTTGRDGRAANSDNVFNLLKFGNVHWTEADFNSTNANMADSMAIMKSHLDFIANELENALLKSTNKVQVVESMVTLQGSILAENAEVKTLNVKSMWGTDPTEFFHSLANQKSETLRIEGGLTFTETLLTKHVETEKINDVLVDNMALLSGHNVFKCSSTFETVHALGDVTVQVVNGHNLANSVVMAHDVNGFTFTDGIVAYKGAETLEHTPFDDVLLSSIAQIVHSPVSFESVKVLGAMSVDALNGNNFNAFSKKIIRNDHQGRITGTKTFIELVNVNTLSIAREWNGLAFPSEFSSTLDDSLVLTGEKSFAELVANKMSVAGDIDGINTDDLVSLTGADVLEKTVWVFTGLSNILNNIEVENTVDGIFMETLLHKGLLDSNTMEFSPNADIVFRQPVHVEDLSVSSTMNDKSFEEIFGNLILFEGAKCMIPGRTTMEMATFSDMHLSDNKINDFLLDNFLTKDTLQTISNPVLITESVFFEELHALEEFDGVRIEHVLQKAIKVSEEIKRDGTMIPWDIHFESIQCNNNFTVDGPINDERAYSSSVALKKGSHLQEINGPIESTKPVFSILAPKNLQLAPGRTLQSLDVNKWNLTRAKLSEPASFSHPFVVNRIMVQENLETQNINGISVEDLGTKVFRNNGKSQQFSGPMTLKKGLSLHTGDLHFHGSVDGFMLDHLIEHGFPLKAKHEKPIMISHNWQFESLNLTNGVTIKGEICGVDLDLLQEDSVKRNDKNVQIFGEKSFTNPLRITQSLTSPQVNGKQIQKMFLLDKDQVVEGELTFASNVSNDALSADSINNVDMTRLAEKYSFVDGQHVIAHNAFIKHQLKTNSLQVDGRVKDRKLNELLADAVKLSDSSIEFSDEIQLTNPISTKDSINTVLYNGVNVDDLSHQVAQLTNNIELANPLSFTNSVSAECVVVNGDLQASNLAKGINWDDLQTKSIKIDDPRAINFGQVHFDDLLVSKPITLSELNGKVFSDFVTLDTDQNLGTLKIGKLSLESAKVKLGGTLGTHDISTEFEDTLMSNKEEPQHILQPTVIKGPVIIKQNISCFGPNLQNEVVTMNDDLVLGPMKFTSPIVVENDVTVNGPIEGRDFSTFFSGALMTDTSNTEQVISGQWEFLGPVTFLNNVSGAGVNDKVNLQAFIDEKNNELGRAVKKVNAQRENFIQKCALLQKMRNEIAKNPVKLDSFDEHQIIALKNEGTNVLAIESSDAATLFVQASNCMLERYQWLSSTKLFHKIVEDSPTHIGNVDVWQSVPLSDGSSVIVFSKSPSACSQELGLFSAIVTPNGDLSPVVTIQNNIPIKSFKALTKPNTGEINLFNLITSVNPGVEVYLWREKEFVFQKFIHLDAPMNRMDVTLTSKGFGIMCYNENTVTMYDIANDHTESIVTSAAMLPSEKGTMAVFRNFDALYALLPESGATSPFLIQPTCNFQVMRLNKGSIESIQKMQVPEVVSATMLSFSNKNFITFLSKSHGLSVYKFMGLNGFQQVGKPYKIFGGLMLKSFSVKQSGLDMPQPYLLVLSKNNVQVFRGNVFGDSLSSNSEQLCDD